MRDTGELIVREYTDHDEPAVLDLLASTLGWVPDRHHSEFLRWKHRDNPFGQSRAWVALDDEAAGQVVGFRAFLRWEFRLVPAGRVLKAVRAVDTATRPDYRGKGIFSRLTLFGFDALRDEGVDFVFNTPNDQSRPGYLKMGWRDVGRLPVGTRLRSSGAALRMMRARTAADLWSMGTTTGEPAADVLAETSSVQALLESLPVPMSGLATRRSAEYLRWRYAGFPALGYRAHLVGADVSDGLVLYRLRQRGAAVEAAFVDVLLPADTSKRLISRTVAAALRDSSADYALTIGTPPGTLPLPGQGPRLTWRSVVALEPQPLAGWHLTLGDVELF